MSQTSVQTLRTKLAQTIAGLFAVSVTILTLLNSEARETAKEQSVDKSTMPSAALTATPTPSPAPYCNWPPTNEDDKCRVIKAFVKALKQSTDTSTEEGKQFRQRLLQCDSTSCTSPTQAVQAILDQDNPNRVTLPMAMFYFDPTKPNGSKVQLKDSKVRSKDASEVQLKGVPLNSCYTILSLPSDVKPPPQEYWNNPVEVFEKHFRCCYQPWAPTVRCSL